LLYLWIVKEKRKASSFSGQISHFQLDFLRNYKFLNWIQFFYETKKKTWELRCYCEHFWWSAI